MTSETSSKTTLALHPSPSPPPVADYPWHTAVRLSSEDSLFYQTLLDALQRTDLPVLECVGFCTGRCERPPDASDPLTLHGVRVIGPVCASRVHRHWILCGTLPLYVLPAPVTTTEHAEPDALCKRFGVFRGLTVHWVAVDRKTWYMQGVPGQYKWTNRDKKHSGAHLAKKTIRVWRFGSVHRADPQHALHRLCDRWTSHTFASTVHSLWVASLGVHQSAIHSVETCCHQIQQLLSSTCGTVCTPALQTQIRKQAEWVYGTYAQQSVQNRVHHVLSTLQWPLGVLVQTLQHWLHTFDTGGHGTIQRTQQHDFARFFQLTLEQTQALFDVTDWKDDSGGVCLSLLCIHCECVMGATANAGPRLPLKRTLVTNERTALVYYELQQDWNTGHHALDAHLWMSIQYKPPAHVDQSVPTTSNVACLPSHMRTHPRYRGASSARESAPDGKRRLCYRGSVEEPGTQTRALPTNDLHQPAHPTHAEQALSPAEDVDGRGTARRSNGGWLAVVYRLFQSGCGPGGS